MQRSLGLLGRQHALVRARLRYPQLLEIVPRRVIRNSLPIIAAHPNQGRPNGEDNPVWRRDSRDKCSEAAMYCDKLASVIAIAADSCLIRCLA